jgi:hypothetical protein
MELKHMCHQSTLSTLYHQVSRPIIGGSDKQHSWKFPQFSYNNMETCNACRQHHALVSRNDL